jgi:hypothetical protein
MQIQEIVSGRSDLLRQFKDRTGTTTDVENLRVVFHFEENNLVAVEGDGDASMIAAIFNPENNCWQHELIPGSRARRMIEYVCGHQRVEDVAKELNRVVSADSRKLF